MKKIIAFLIAILFTLIGIVSIALALSSVMLFDAPGSENNTYLWVVFYSALALPFASFGSVIASRWIVRKSKNYNKALFVFIIPCMVIITLIVGLVLIEVYCHGNFSCS